MKEERERCCGRGPGRAGRGSARERGGRAPSSVSVPPSPHAPPPPPRPSPPLPLLRYSFEYPSNWKVETIGKQEKGMVGIDARVRAPGGRPGSAPQAYVITFGRAGEDNKAFKLGDVDRTLEGFAGADYNLQDALTAATSKKAVERAAAEREEGVGAFYDYEVAGPDFTYLAAVTLKSGKVFALFVACPTKGFKGAEAQLRHIVETFKTL